MLKNLATQNFREDNIMTATSKRLKYLKKEE